ncbi:MAG: hypothetical protein J0L88_14225 [Xanthomonadales bacterium]|nr:hypothetical protein [Xanthomonadales bacterium]
MDNSHGAIESAVQAGIDLALVDDNLRLSHEQRALQHQDALDLAPAIEDAGRRMRERPADAAARAR